MPIVVYKTISYSFQYAKAYRINCDHCHTPFTLISGGSAYTQVRGAPYISVVAGHDSMRNSAFLAGKRIIRQFAKRQRYGQGLCPHCHCYQPWMVNKSRWKWIAKGVAFGAVVGILVVFTEATLYWKWFTALGAAIGGSIGFACALKHGPHTMDGDARVRTDKELSDFLAECDDHDTEPFITWWQDVSKVPEDDKTVLVSLGLDDKASGFPISPQLATEYVLSTEGFLGGKKGDPLNLLREFRVRLRPETVRGEGGYEYVYTHVEVKGDAPVETTTRLGFAASVLDFTKDPHNDDGEEWPVVCGLEGKQEAETPCFFAEREVGSIDEGVGWSKWVSVLGIIPETLVPPRGGMRRFRIRLWALDLDSTYAFRHGRCVEGTPLSHWDCDFDWQCKGIGWQEQEGQTMPSENQGG